MQMRGCETAWMLDAICGWSAGNGKRLVHGDQGVEQEAPSALGCPLALALAHRVCLAKHTVCSRSPPGRGSKAGTSRREAGKTKTKQENGGVVEADANKPACALQYGVVTKLWLLLKEDGNNDTEPETVRSAKQSARVSTGARQGTQKRDNQTRPDSVACEVQLLAKTAQDQYQSQRRS